MLARARSRLAFLQDVARRIQVERHYRRNPPPIAHGAKHSLVVEGLWDNPNHWLRLWIFLHAFLQDTKADVIGILRSRDNWDNWRKRKSLEALGIRRFFYLDEKEAARPDYLTRAGALLEPVSDARQVLNLELPDRLPGYVYFDTMLKQEQHPQPKVKGSAAWKESLADLLVFGDLYRELFQQNKVVGVVSSHAWKSEWATLCWTALRAEIPFFYMTAHYDSIRVRKMDRIEDYSAPNEHLPYAQFQLLPQAAQERLIERGRAYLADRFAGNSDFIVLRYSIDPKQRGRSRASTVEQLGLDPQKPLVVIYAHSWFDFPHTQNMTNFTEPLDWIQFTLKVISLETAVNWAIKPHPCDRWYGNIQMERLIHDLPAHVKIIPENSDSLAIQSVADALVTIQGSIAIEGAAMGKPVLCADRSVYTEWGFTHAAQSREDYADKLRGILKLSAPTVEQSHRAMAFAATALAPPPAEAEWLKLTCDSRFTEGTLYPKLRSMLEEDIASLEGEVRKMREWFGADYHSYNAWRTVDNCLQRDGESR
jgi:hypothetical protein